MTQKKRKNLNVRTACFWNPESKQFENPTGIDAKLKSTFDFETVWADTHPLDYVDFANNKPWAGFSTHLLYAL